ncbi:MAG: 5-deoxy-glucuronate isomerase [Chloroflexota bacterium]
MEQVVRIKQGSGYHEGVGKANGLNYVSMDMLHLKAGESWSGPAIEEETVLVTLGGTCGVAVQGKHPVEWPKVGGRPHMFAGAPGVAYIPRRTPYSVTGVSDVEIIVFKGPADADLAPELVSAEALKPNSTGAYNWRRDVKMLFSPATGKTSRLIVGETINPPGNWSGFPPHKHDVVAGDEYPLEEIYVFKTMPVDGFGVQVIYGGQEGDSAHIVQDNSVAAFPTGYHPSVGAPGTQLGFVWALAGDARKYQVSIDPRYRWLANVEPILKEKG